MYIIIMDKRTFITKSAAALVGLAAIGGIATATFAFNNNGAPGDSSVSYGHGTGQGPGMMSDMSAEERTEWRNNREERRAEFQQHREEAREALEAGDYDAWTEATREGCPLKEEITEEDFSRIAEAYNSGEDMGSIMEDLGVERGPGRGHGKAPGMGAGGHGGCPMR